jgi:putative NADPH-quinone reductase
MERLLNATVTTSGDRSHLISDGAPEGYHRNNYQLSNIYSDSGGHNKGAGTIAILNQYYDRDIAFNVSLLVQADLELFHYPLWTGRNASKHVSSLRFDKS